jgi:tRNA threonylcarbamoyladenosine biosynthesis protein TsaE
MAKYESSSAEQTKQIAEELAKNTTGNIFALNGELGAGKTIFVQGFARGLGIKDKIISPTFVLMRQHYIPAQKKVLYHIDLYRLENLKDIKNLGLEEIWSDQNSIVLIEWAEKIKTLLPKNTVTIRLEKTAEDKRLITIE